MLAVLAAFMLIIMAGQAMVYTNNPYYCGYTVAATDGEAEVRVDTNYSLQYTVNSLRTDSLASIDTYVIYYDSERPVIGDRTVLEGCMDRLKLCFSNDNTVLGTVDTEGLLRIIEGDTSVAVLFMTGVLPEEVYSGHAGDPIFKWLEAGGVMYWLHEKIGQTYSGIDGKMKHVADPDALFFGCSDVVNQTTDQVYTKNLVEGSLTDKMGIYYGETTNGVDTSKLGGPYLSLDYNDGVYSAVVFSKYHGGEGMVGVFGGQIKYEAVPMSTMASVAQSIVSKLSYDTVLIDSATSSGSDTLTLRCGEGYSYIFMYVDKVNAIWAKITALR